MRGGPAFRFSRFFLFFSSHLSPRTPVRERNNVQWLHVITAAKYEIHMPGPPPAHAENRVWGSGFEHQDFIGASSWLSCTLHRGCWQIYDGTPVGLPVGLDYFGARYMSSAQGVGLCRQILSLVQHFT